MKTLRSLVLAFSALLSLGLAASASAQSRVTVVDFNGAPYGTSTNPMFVGRPDMAVVTTTPRSATGDLFSVDTLGWDYVAFQLTGTWTGTVSFEESDDNVTWHSAGAAPSSGQATATTATVNGAFVRPVTHRYFRARVSTFTSGTFTSVAYLRSGPSQNVASVQGAVTASGSVSHSATNPANPVQTGGVVQTAADTTLVAGDAARFAVTTGGAQINWPFGPPELFWQSVTNLTTTSDVSVRVAAGAGIRNYTASSQMVNTGAADAVVNYKDGATIIGTFSIKPGETRDMNFSVPLRGTAATAVNAACLAACTVTVNAQGFTAP